MKKVVSYKLEEKVNYMFKITETLLINTSKITLNILNAVVTASYY